MQPLLCWVVTNLRTGEDHVSYFPGEADRQILELQQQGIASKKTTFQKVSEEIHKVNGGKILCAK